jgi:sensor histidine kinase YesM
MYEFIFTTKRPGKYLRHLAFWAAQSIFWVIWAGSFFYSFQEWMKEMVVVYLNIPMILAIGYTYLIVYSVFPIYFVRKRLLKFLVLFFACSLITYGLFVWSLFVMSGTMNTSKDNQLLMGWYFTMNFIINGPPVICAMFLTLKMLKTWYIKMEEKQALVKENAQAELQLLKAQVHPHFLFNTLNNIYSFTLVQSPDGGGLVLKLSDTLRYMIYDCEADSVPLEKEVQLMRNYLGLEKVRYGNRLLLEVDINGNYENKMIAPLLMIPFIENSFKHGASVMRGRQWIKLQLTIQEGWLYFYISNSKPVQPVVQKGKEGIGLLNVQKRLLLLYPGKHSLEIESTDDIYTVRLMIKLEEQFEPKETGTPIVHTQPVWYA